MVQCALQAHGGKGLGMFSFPLVFGEVEKME